MTPLNPRRTRRSYDTFHMGRSGMDLYSNDVGANFVYIVTGVVVPVDGGVLLTRFSKKRSVTCPM